MDHDHLREEYLAFRNAGNAELDLGGWTIHDAAEEEDRVTEGEHTFTIPDGVSLAAGASLSLHTGSAPEPGVNDDTAADRQLYWGKRWPVWNNDADIVVVCDGDGQPVFATRYELTDDGTYVFGDPEPTGLEEWFPSIPVGEREVPRIPEVSTDRRFGVGALSNVYEFVTGALFLRGSDQFVSCWAQITTFLLIATITWALATSMGMLTASVDPIAPLLMILGAFGMTVVGGVIVLSQKTIRFLVDLFT